MLWPNVCHPIANKLLAGEHDVAATYSLPLRKTHATQFLMICRIDQPSKVAVVFRIPESSTSPWGYKAFETV